MCSPVIGRRVHCKVCLVSQFRVVKPKRPTNSWILSFCENCSRQNRVCYLWLGAEITKCRLWCGTAFAWRTLWDRIGSTVGDGHRTERGCEQLLDHLASRIGRIQSWVSAHCHRLMLGKKSIVKDYIRLYSLQETHQMWRHDPDSAFGNEQEPAFASLPKSFVWQSGDFVLRWKW